MKLLLRGTDIIGLPIVTLGGEDIAEAPVPRWGWGVAPPYQP